VVGRVYEDSISLAEGHIPITVSSVFAPISLLLSFRALSTSVLALVTKTFGSSFPQRQG